MWLKTIADVQSHIEKLRGDSYFVGREVRVYKFIGGSRKGGTPDKVGILSKPCHA